jgi:hypothetical protein
MKPGSKVLYLGAASGTSVSHVADIVGPTGAVYVCRRHSCLCRSVTNNAPRPSNSPTAPAEILSTWRYVNCPRFTCCIQDTDSLIDPPHQRYPVSSAISAPRQVSV